MPELPEIRAHAERLTDHYAGAPLERFDALSFTALKTAVPPPSDALGTPLEAVGQRGKHLLLRFAPATFVVHLMQGGRLKPDPKVARKPRGGIARWTFTGPGALLLTEAGTQKRAGVWVVSGDPEASEPLAHLGPEADTVDAATLVHLGAEHRMRLHGFLRDQRIISGIGRRLANEVCHRAKLSPFTSTGKLTEAQAAAIVDAIHHCIDTSLAEERARPDMSSSADRPAAVHHRQGQPCPVCGDSVRAIEYASYTVNYCATCQTGGKVLADNTTSKFLK